MENLVLSQTMVSKVKQSLIDGLTIASGAKSSATYYHGKDEQMKAIQTQILNLYKLSKELPLIIASQKGATGRFVSEVLLNEFKQTLKGGACNIVNPIDWYDNGLSDKAVLSALNNLGENGLPYVLRLFVDLKNARVNNERTRKIVLGFIWGQDNLEFYAMKYRNKIAQILRHTYGIKKTSILLSIAQKQSYTNGLFDSDKELSIANELILKYFNGDSIRAFKLLLFLFKKNGVEYGVNEFPILSEYQKAQTDITNISVIPEEVLLGLISSVKHPQYHNMWSTDIQKEATKAMIRNNVKVTSINQQVRQTKSTAKLGVQKHVEIEKATDFLALYKTGYETGSFTPTLVGAINELAKKKKITGFHYQNIGIILDDSVSMTGHKAESKNTPRAIADFTSKVLTESTKESVLVKTNDETTDIATSFIELLKYENPRKAYDAIFILTDGYENAYDGLTNEVISIYRQEIGNQVSIFQISPITGAEMGANVRPLGQGVVTTAINNPIAIQPQISARLLEIDTKRWLENQVLALEASPVKRTKKNYINA